MVRHKSQKKKNLSLERSGKYDALDAFDNLSLENRPIDNKYEEYTEETDRALTAADTIRERIALRCREAIQETGTPNQLTMYRLVFEDGNTMQQAADLLGVRYFSVNSALMGQKGGKGLLEKVQDVLSADSHYQMLVKHLIEVSRDTDSPFIEIYLQGSADVSEPLIYKSNRGRKLGVLNKKTGKREAIPKKPAVSKKKSPYKGVYHDPTLDNWKARIHYTKDKKRIEKYVGTYDTPEEAKIARDKMIDKEYPFLSKQKE